MALAVAVVAACTGDDPGLGQSDGTTVGPTTTVSALTITTAPPDPVLVVAGDIACQPAMPATPQRCQHPATADLAAGLDPDVVVLPGDLQYDRGELDSFRASFGATWGRFGDKLRPVPGNHEYDTTGAAGYYAYFSELGIPTGAPSEGWYSFHVGQWELYALNSNCQAVGGCEEGSAQHAWLEAELARSSSRCALAFWHHPRFSSGLHGDDLSLAPLFDALDRGGVDLGIAGHDHSYERFARLTADGRPSDDGVRQFVVGTGGHSLHPIVSARGFSEARESRRFGVLELRLGTRAYAWRFMSLGREVLDSGEDACR